WLTSCDDEALAGGANLAAIGSELIQFGEATSLGPGQFRLSRLLRGRGGTEWASSIHGVGELFCVIESGAVQPLILPSWSVGALVTATLRYGPAASMVISAESLRPPQLVNLTAAVQPTGGLEINWTRRSRAAWGWVDEVETPLGERLEQYRVALTGPATNAEFLSDEPSLSLSATTVASFGPGPINIDVRQIGDFAVSRAAQLSINLP
ncbi:MAG: hypothetical protein ABI454_02155, partial [Sphingomicrobium sp.]